MTDYPLDEASGFDNQEVPSPPPTLSETAIVEMNDCSQEELLAIITYGEKLVHWRESHEQSSTQNHQHIQPSNGQLDFHPGDSIGFEENGQEKYADIAQIHDDTIEVWLADGSLQTISPNAVVRHSHGSWNDGSHRYWKRTIEAEDNDETKF